MCWSITITYNLVSPNPYKCVQPTPNVERLWRWAKEQNKRQSETNWPVRFLHIRYVQFVGIKNFQVIKLYIIYIIRNWVLVFILGTCITVFWILHSLYDSHSLSILQFIKCITSKNLYLSWSGYEFRVFVSVDQEQYYTVDTVESRLTIII